MVAVRIPGVTQSKTAKPIVGELVEGASAAEKRALLQMLAAAASTDGNVHLDQTEASLVRDAYHAARTPAGVDLARFEAGAKALLDERLRSRDLDGIRPYFTATTPNINRIIIDEMRSTIAQANGKPVDFNIMIFSFVDPEIGDAILDMAQQHPNVTFRCIADFGMLTDDGKRQPPRIFARAQELGLENIGIKYKKDAPWVWDEAKGRPKYVHTATKGLNHHKGFVACIDGAPVKLITGSYNWSKTADDKNYEDLFVIDATNPANRPAIAAYQAEFVAYYNHPDTLNTAEAKYHKAEFFNALRVAHGQRALPLPPAPVADAVYVPRPPSARFDINTMDDGNYGRLRALVGDARVLSSIVRNFAAYGRFSSLENLRERVPSIARMSQAKQQAIADGLEFGDGRVLINSASVSELERSLKLPRNVAVAIVAERARVGDFESADDLRNLPGMTEALLARIAPRLNDDIARMYFSSRPFSAEAASRGYAPENNDRKVPVMGVDGVVAPQDATLGAGVTDLLRRAKPGDTARIAMYGMGVNTPEYNAIVEAAARGVHVKVVLNDDYNEAPAAALQELARRGQPIEVRVQKARTMHEKFGVVNDDFFFGTANMSGSSTTKHSEDRLVIKNNAEVAKLFVEEFELLWGRSRPVA